MPTRRRLEYKYIYIRVFYTECLYAWSGLTSTAVNSYEDVINQIIWNNKNIGIQNESIFDELLFSQGVVKTGDLISETGNFFQSAKLLQVNLSPIQSFKLMSIVDTIPLMIILFGAFIESKDNIILNHIILMAKFYIHNCKLNNVETPLKVFVAKVK